MIYKIEDLASHIDTLKSKGLKIVLCHGVFDLIHLGHIKHLQRAKEMGDILVVTITPDIYVNKGPGKPKFNEDIRAEVIDSISYVDCVAINRWNTAVETIKLLKPNIYVKGTDYANIDNDITGAIKNEIEAIKSVGGDIRYTNEITFSSSNLINNVILSDESKAFLESFKKRYTISDIKRYIDSISDLYILGIGEIIIDEYQFGHTLGKSGKFPVVAFNNEKIETYEGGILAIRNHLKSFCKVDISTGWRQIIKKRYIQDGQKLFETYSYRDDLGYDESKAFAFYDILLVADFGHNYISKDKRDAIVNSNKFFALNTQFNAGNEGLNTLKKYDYIASYICIDEHELRLAFSNNEDSVEHILEYWKDKPITICVTNRDKGCTLYKGGEIMKVPAFATKIIDTVGAGDALFSITTPLVFNRIPLEVIGFIGNCVGAIACSYQGNSRYVTKDSLLKYMETLLK